VRVVQETGAAIVGATDDIAPADRRLYAIRDVTGTVESLDLITASILSKKLAAGLDALVMDVKTGNGAFAPTLEAAEALAGSLLDVGSGAGLAMRALITDMNQVLGWTAGNALEVAEASDVLAGRAAEPRLVRVTTALAAELLALGGLAADPADGERRVRTVLADGRAAERFERMVRALGGPADLVARPEAVLPVAPVRLPVPPARPGTVTAVDTRALGLAVIRLGGGRLDVGDRIDGAVGLAMLAGPGERVDPAGRPLAMLHAATPESAAAIAPEVAAAFTLDEDVPEGEQGNGSLTARDQGPAAADPVIRVLKPPTSA
jgi:thymidine phosphorylase